MLGVRALAAASSIFPVLFFLISFFFGIAGASTVLIGQAYGARDEPRLCRAAGTTLMFAILFGVVLGSIGFVLARPLLQMIATPPDVIDNSVRYADIIFLSLPVLFVYLGYTTFLRGIGDTRSPLIVLIASTSVAIVLTPLLIRGAFGFPGLGIIAAPISNMISTGLGLIGLLTYLERSDNPLALGKVRHYLRIEMPLLLTLIRIGIPTGIQFVMVSLSEIAVLSFVNRFGSSATAAYGAVNQIVSYVQFPAIRHRDHVVDFRCAVDRGRTARPVAQDRARRRDVELRGRRRVDRRRVPARPRDPLAVPHRSGHVDYGARTALDHALELRDLREHQRAVGHDARERQRALAHGHFHLLDLGVEVPVAWVLSHGSLGLRGVWVAYPVAFTVALTLQSAYYFGVWRRKPIRALHESPLADAEGERIIEAETASQTLAAGRSTVAAEDASFASTVSIGGGGESKPIAAS